MKAMVGGLRRQASVGAAVALLLGCGGGDKAPVSPTKPVAVPTPSAPVVIFTSPGSQEYAVAGVSTPDAGDGYTPVEANARLRTLQFGPADQPRIRHASTGQYELQLPGSGFDALVHYKGLLIPSPDNNFFQPQSAALNAATFIITLSRLQGYGHSEIAAWTAVPAGAGILAFGPPTAAVAVPDEGRATYRGKVEGLVDITYFNQLYGGHYFESVIGAITLEVDFATRVATASLDLRIRGASAETHIGSFTSAPLAMSPTGNDFSGLMTTVISGFNRVDGLFTGPAANEAIGRFALPVSINGTPHQVMGAWIAAKP